MYIDDHITKFQMQVLAPKNLLSFIYLRSSYHLYDKEGHIPLLSASLGKLYITVLICQQIIQLSDVIKLRGRTVNLIQQFHNLVKLQS